MTNWPNERTNEARADLALSHSVLPRVSFCRRHHPAGSGPVRRREIRRRECRVGAAQTARGHLQAVEGVRLRNTIPVAYAGHRLHRCATREAKTAGNRLGVSGGTRLRLICDKTSRPPQARWSCADFPVVLATAVSFVSNSYVSRPCLRLMFND